MKKRAVFIAAALSLFISSCALGDSVSLLEVRQKTFKDASGSFTVEATTKWNEDQRLHEESRLSLANTDESAYFISLLDHKSAFSSEMNLRLYSELAGEATAEGLQDAITDGMDRIAVNGMVGYEFTITGMIEGVRITYMFVIIEDAENFIQLVIWSSEKMISENRLEYMKILTSFERID
ncbi:hypothetical protein [Youngiibacter fragilis]|uniref:PsbP C-terminal domain-containing protein n=1 Tax=Youngiibacter fragilis 232.1 TaxID=994573 RepID=V7I7S4_9CLOT|nr:hypothetical protein [Youngiibacter fragilis]ETA81284.1 hypothetical protein T472_0207165 [Youngiibacter fragilis 232.1]